MEARALAYIAERPTFNPFVKVKDQCVIVIVFDVWVMEREFAAILQAAAAVARRWPDVWTHYWISPSRGPKILPSSSSNPGLARGGRTRRDDRVGPTVDRHTRRHSSLFAPPGSRMAQ